MNFQDLIEEFFKQYTTSLGVEPNLKAEFESASQYDDYVDFTPGKPKDSIKKFPKVFISPRLPFDYTAEEQQARVRSKKKIDYPGESNAQKRFENRTDQILKRTPLDEPWQSLMTRYGVQEDYNLTLKLIDISKAQKRENYSLQHTMRVIGVFYKKYWEDPALHLGQDRYFGQINFDNSTEAPAVHIPQEIQFDIEKWIRDRHQKKEETTETYDLIQNMYKDLTWKRKENIERLLLCELTGCSPHIEGWDINKHISNQLWYAKKYGITHLDPHKSAESQKPNKSIKGEDSERVYTLEDMQGAFGTEPEEKVDKDKSAQDLPKDHHAQEFEAVTGYPSPPQDDSTLDEKDSFPDEQNRFEESNTDNKNHIEKMLTVLNDMTSKFKKNWYDGIDTITEKELDFEIVGLRALLHEINWLKKLSIKEEYDLNSELFKELIRTEKELMAIQNSIKFSDSSKVIKTSDESKDLSKEDSTLDKDGTSEKESTKEIRFKNNFNNKSYESIYDHFKEGLVDGDREYLSEEKLKEWIEEAFGNFDDKFDWKNRKKEDYPDPIENRYLFTNTTNAIRIIKDVFYRFYQICGSPKGDAPKYSTLCGNYFEEETPKKVLGNWQKLQREQAKIKER